jgi:hypothetical protein
MNKLQSSVPFLILAFLCGLASFGIAFTAFVAMAAQFQIRGCWRLQE